MGRTCSSSGLIFVVRRLTILATVAALSGCAPAKTKPSGLDFRTVRPAGTLEGRWVGGTDVLGSWILIEADFRRDGGGLTGELRAPSENVSRLPVTAAAADAAGVRFAFRSPFGTHQATGQWEGGILFGRIEGGGLSGAFHLVPVAPVDPAEARGRAGMYAERPGHALLVMDRALGGAAWAETEPLDDGALWIAGGGLYGFARDTMFTDRSIRAEPRVHEWAVSQADGSIEWHPETRPVRTTAPVADPVVQEEVAFSNGDVRLAGTLLRPAGPGPFPAAVLVHGSGPVERTSLLGMLRASLLLRRGIGVLLYDKRGVAGSTGDWESAGIDDLAGDAAAAIDFLRAQPGIDRTRVGLIGHSQAGWVIPAAARRAKADFLIVLSGGGVSPERQEVFRARAEAGAAGLPVDQAVRLMELKWEYARTGEGWDAYIAAVREADPRVVGVVEAQMDRDPARWELTRRLAGYDPVPDLRAIATPVLVVLGADDDNVPVEAAAGIWREALPPSLLAIETVPGVGHALVGQREGRGSIFPARFVQVLDRWLAAQAIGLTAR